MVVYIDVIRVTNVDCVQVIIDNVVIDCREKHDPTHTLIAI